MRITFLIGKIILGGYWLMVGPALFLPLGAVLLGWQALRGIFRYLVLLLAAVAALGVIFLLTLTLPDAVTVLAGVQAIWWMAAAITFVARNGKQGGSPSQQLRTFPASFLTVRHGAKVFPTGGEV